MRGISIVNFGTQPANESAVHIDGGSGDTVSGQFHRPSSQRQYGRSQLVGVVADNGATGVTVGGPNLGDANVVSRSHGDGIDVIASGSASTATIQGNSVGFAGDGTTARGNSGDGIHLRTVDGPNPHPAVADVVTSNDIANSYIGVAIGGSYGDADTRAEVTRNLIYGNGGLGIDIAPFATVNWPGSSNGPNLAIPCPCISSASLRWSAAPRAPTAQLRSTLPRPTSAIHAMARQAPISVPPRQSSAALGRWGPVRIHAPCGDSSSPRRRLAPEQATPVTSDLHPDVIAIGGPPLQ